MSESTPTTLSTEQVLYNVLDYLQFLKSSGLNEDSVESLDVATQCLSSAFSIDLSDAAARARLSLGPSQNFPSLLAFGASSKEKLAEALEALKKKQTELQTKIGDSSDIETKFTHYLQAIKTKGFFSGVTPGTPEYETRFLRAREKFIEKQFSKTPSNPAAAPTAAPTVVPTPSTETTKEKPVDVEAAEKFKGEGNNFLHQKNYAKAIESYTKAIELNSKNAIYYSNRAAAYSQSGDHNSALKDALEATTLDPNYSKAWGRLGLANFSLGKYSEAMSNYRRALELEPNSESFKASLDAAQKKVIESAPATTGPTGAGGMPDLSSMMNDPDMMNRMSSMLGGAGGMESIFSNPMFQNMAQQVMSNPQMMNMANSLMQNPDALNNMMSAFGNMGGKIEFVRGVMLTLSADLSPFLARASRSTISIEKALLTIPGGSYRDLSRYRLPRVDEHFQLFPAMDTRLFVFFLILGAVFAQTCTPLGQGSRGPNDPYWLENPRFHNGKSPYNSNANYPIFRNSYGAKGDGVTDDSDAINAAIQAGGQRCGLGCDSTTVAPALVYFPSGTYLVSKQIVMLYYTQIVGDANNLPTILAASNMQNFIFQSDPYGPSGNSWFTNQNNFYRQIRNFIIDTTRVPAATNIVAVHWQVAQATSLTNIVFKMNSDSNSGHQGVWMENGSGGFMSDLIFYGGKYGLWVGTQQFTSRNMTFYNTNTAIFMNWNWGWTFKTVNFHNCKVGIDLSTTNAGQQVGSLLLVDAEFTDTPVAVRTSMNATTLPVTAGTLLLDNVKITNVGATVATVWGETLLAGSQQTTVVDSWGQGHFVKDAASDSANFFRGALPKVPKNGPLLSSNGYFFERPRPQYEQYSVNDIINVKDEGAKGDGSSDDTAALTAILKKYAGCKIIYFPFGQYVITSTLFVPPGSRIVGEAWAMIKASGNFFADFRNPKPAVQVGLPGQEGVAEISDIIFNTAGNTGGAIVVEWNIRDPAGSPGVTGLWDSHFRIGGSAGTNMQRGNCPSLASPKPECYGAHTLLHLTATSSAYLENVWAGRGILVESRQGPVWMYGTASEHNVLYQYSLQNAQNVLMAMIQTETPYYQGTPQAPAPFFSDSVYNDPVFQCNNASDAACGMAWGLNVVNSRGIYVYGAGLYNFFDNYNQDCLKGEDCQTNMFNLKTSDGAGPGVYVYNLNTKASTNMVLHNGRPVVDQSLHRNGFCSSILGYLGAAGNGSPQPLPTTSLKPTTAKPTTAQPTTAKPTTAKPTTAKPTTPTTTIEPTNGGGNLKPTQTVYFSLNNTAKFVTSNSSDPFLKLAASRKDATAYVVAQISGRDVYSIQDVKTKQFTSADGNGGAPLIANRGSPSGWEFFTFEKNGGLWAIKADDNKKYVSVQSDGRLQATDDQPKDLWKLSA
ncbi:glycoside hydrolase family 55 protein [Planoprotostelium fungivorum]|uniref:Glycoside hydrolase family 55 protein n=1 Tax=Planoprotostelium fungivorum TaxID=1890364 RepID=A0A2P6N7Q0_9EUKA|nr:glycoside hydrolase family 55 protein [Planoprotostelium fungivorum]